MTLVGETKKGGKRETRLVIEKPGVEDHCIWKNNLRTIQEKEQLKRE